MMRGETLLAPKKTHDVVELMSQYIAINFPGTSACVERTGCDEITVSLDVDDYFDIQDRLESIFGKYANRIDIDYQASMDNKIQDEIDAGDLIGSSCFPARRICWKEENGNLHHATTTFLHAFPYGEGDYDEVSSMSFIPSGAKIVGVVEFYPVDIVCVESKSKSQ